MKRTEIKKAYAADEKKYQEIYSALAELERTETVLKAMEINRQVQEYRLNVLLTKEAKTKT